MITYLKIEGFKSVKSLELAMGSINILIGSNGSGKSNFISFFKLVNAIFNKRLQKFVLEEKADNILHFGRRNTDRVCGKMIFSENGNANNNAYRFELAQNKEAGLYLEIEGSGYNVSPDNDVWNYFISSNLEESKIPDSSTFRNNYLKKYLTNLQVFHFHDTSNTSLLRRECEINDNRFFRQDGRNLPAFLYFLQVIHPQIFSRIIKVIKSVAPYIDRFILEPSRLNEQIIELRWVDRGDTESNFSAYQLSDGTMRFIALAALLMQPVPPSVIIIDEPELGLHPFAIGVLSGIIKSASTKTQIIVATQSPGLISHFSPEDVVVIDRDEEKQQTYFRRLQSENLNQWLQEFTLGHLWESNIINSGQPFSK